MRLRLGIVLLALCVPALAQYVTLTGKIQGANGIVVANDTISFTPTQVFFVAGTGQVAAVTSECATSVDGTVVGVQNPLNPPQVSAVYSGTLGVGTYYVEEAWYDASSNTTLVGPEIPIQLTGTGQIQELPPASGLPAAVVGRKIYIGATSGSETLQGSVVGSGVYVQSVPLVSGAAVPSTNGTICQVIANDAGWPTGTGYQVSLTTPAGGVLPGYPMQWQLLGPSGTVNLSQGLPLYNGTVIYPSPILASPYNHSPQSISGPLSLGLYSFSAGATTTCSLNGMPVVNPGCYAGSDFGAQVNAAMATCGAPQGCLVHIPPGRHSYTTPIVVPNAAPITVSCDPGGTDATTTQGTTVLNYTPTSGVAITWGNGWNGTGLKNCVLEGNNLANSTTGLYLSTSQGSVFDNLDISGFGVGLSINTAASHVYIDMVVNPYIHGNTTNLYAIANGGVTNENVTFVGGTIFQNTGSYSATCVNIANFEMKFVNTSFDGCPVTIQGGANSHFSFISSHFEFVLGATNLDAITVASGCSPCQITVIDPEVVEDFASTRTEYFSDAGSGTFTLIAPQLYDQETVQTMVRKENVNLVVQVQNPSVGGASTINSYVLNTITNAVDFGLTGVTGNPTNGYYQSVRDTAGCTTPGTAGASCATAVTIVWPVPFADVNYSATCTGRGITNQPGPVYIVSKGTTQLVFNYQAQTSGPASFTDVDCIAVHD